MADWLGSIDARLVVGVLLAAALLVGGGLRGPRAAQPPPAAERVDRYGDLELVTHERRFRAGDPGGTGTTQDWSLRWLGQPLSIDTLGGMFGDTPAQASVVNAVFVLGSGEHPELIVNVGDPNNTSAFHLLTQQDGKLSTALLCVAPAGNNHVAWIDGPDARHGSQGLYSGPQHRVLRGGSWLMLGDGCLYDVARRHAIKVPASAGNATVWTSVPPLGVSPDGRRLARFGTLTVQDEQMPHILVADLASGTWAALPVDRPRMRYPTHEAIDNAWLAHHFEWKRGTDGQDRLAERKAFKPLPWRGRFDSTGFNYAVDGIQVDASPHTIEFLQRRFQAVHLPPAHVGGDPQRFRVRGEVIQVVVNGFFVESGRPYEPGQPGDPARQMALVKELGEAFDAELAEGRHDALFVAPPASR